MNPIDILSVRSELSRQMGQKAEAMRLEAERECLRYEGAIGAIKDVVAFLTTQAEGIKQSSDDGRELELCEAAIQAVTSSMHLARALDESAKAGLVSSRGRVAQAEKTLDMMQAFFDADQAAAKLARADADAPPRGDSGRHPGPSLGDQRRNEEAGNGGDPGPSGPDSLP